MRSKLIFYFYISSDWKERKSNKSHFECLKDFSDIFDEALILLSIDDVTDKKTIQEVEQHFLTLGFNGNISFKIRENSQMREAIAFKEEVVDKLEELKDCFVFWGHGKGFTNDEKNNEDNIKAWIASMYYFSLHFKDKCFYKMMHDGAISVGFPHVYYDDVILPFYNNIIYQWAYLGTFFWLNINGLINVINKNKIHIPLCQDRFYAENFLGSIMPFECSASYNAVFLKGITGLYKNTMEYINLAAEREDYEDFKKYLEKL